MNKTLSVAAIKNGTVIDHIRPGQALRILQSLEVFNSKHKVTIGLNLPGKSIGRKDIIKIENRILTHDEANKVVVFSTEATINIIKEFEVVQKINTHLPDVIANAFTCPNPICVTRMEPIESLFHILEQGKQIK